MSSVVVCNQLVVVYRVGESEVIALQGLDLSVEHGEMLAIVGSSGSGKSTLLSVLSGLQRPTGGHVVFGDVDLGQASRRTLDEYRRTEVGFLWQDSARNLLPYLTATENVALPLRTRGNSDAKERANELLRRVGLADRRKHRPAELSGGEQQRVALAVALAHEPKLMLADEPTGELDRASTEAIFALMREIGTETGLSQVIVSHDPEITHHVDRVVSLRDGRVASERRIDTSPEGTTEIVEVTMVDSIGRLQLTDEQLDVLGGDGRVHTAIVDDRIEIRGADPHE